MPKETEERLKNPPIALSILNKFDMTTYYSFKNNYENFARILSGDKRIKEYKQLLWHKKINKHEFKLLFIAHVKYYYDIDLTKNYGNYFKHFNTR